MNYFSPNNWNPSPRTFPIPRIQSKGKYFLVHDMKAHGGVEL
jgi:hypothetical protein